jgi:hypothetical protein
MPLGHRAPAAREAAAAVPVVQRPPQRRGNRPRAGSDLDDAPVFVVAHHHPARVARQASRRLRGNARPAREDGLPGLIGVGQHRRVDVDHHLVPLARPAGIQTVMQGGLREQRQRVRLLLGPGGRVGGRVRR